MYQDKLLVSELTILTNPSNLIIQVEARRSWLAEAVPPSKINSWCYVNVSKPKAPQKKVLPTYVGPVINVASGAPLTVRWINTLRGMTIGTVAMQEMPPINPPDMANIADYNGMNPSVGVVAHLHGAKVLPGSDGWPLDPVGYVGNASVYHFPTSRTYTYPNRQRAAMLWFHDHGMDNTAPQVHAGLAGLYFIRDKSDDKIFKLIGGPGQEIPLVIQDRVADCGFTAIDYSAGIPMVAAPIPSNPHNLGFDRSEFLGELIFVNGRPSPYHFVASAVYRLRVLNGSNARTYALALMNPADWAAPAVSGRVWRSDLLTVIGNDGGLFPVSKRLKSTESILIAPGERLDMVLDLTGIDPNETKCLRLVNLAVNSIANRDWPEAIFQTVEPICDGATTVASSLVTENGEAEPGATDERDKFLQTILTLPQANVLQFCFPDPAAADPPAKPPSAGALDAVLAAHANDEGAGTPKGEGFAWNGSALTTVAGAPVACNRLVLLMNNTANLNPGDPGFVPHPLGLNWKDTQLWELVADDHKGATWQLPFDVDLVTPAAGAPGPRTYRVKRATFFAVDPPRTIDAAPHTYEALHPDPFKPAQGTYERWYVANVGNGQPTLALENGVVPDMHPFHMHLVNFVVTRRFRLDPKTNVFADTTGGRELDFDTIARHDTVRIQSNELLELLVYFPKGYTGQYPYHCHIVEHEDMGMMLHFEAV